jgi:hypothetical protein
LVRDLPGLSPGVWQRYTGCAAKNLEEKLY